MNVKRKQPIPDVKATFSGKEVRKLLREFDKLCELIRFDRSVETPTIDEFVAQLEEAAGEFC